MRSIFHRLYDQNVWDQFYTATCLVPLRLSFQSSYRSLSDVLSAENALVGRRRRTFCQVRSPAKLKSIWRQYTYIWFHLDMCNFQEKCNTAIHIFPHTPLHSGSALHPSRPAWSLLTLHVTLLLIHFFWSCQHSAVCRADCRTSSKQFCISNFKRQAFWDLQNILLNQSTWCKYKIGSHTKTERSTTNSSGSMSHSSW